MANKLFTVFLMCMVVLAAVHFHKAEATKTDAEFKSCYNTCHQDCFQNGKGNGYTFCETKCDNDCSSSDIKATLGGLEP